MCRNKREILVYEHAQLEKELNELLIRTKVHLYLDQDDKLRSTHRLPTVEEFDAITGRAIRALLDVNKPARKYHE